MPDTPTNTSSHFLFPIFTCIVEFRPVYSLSFVINTLLFLLHIPPILSSPSPLLPFPSSLLLPHSHPLSFSSHPFPTNSPCPPHLCSVAGSPLSFILHSKKTAFIVEHDFIMATYLADRVVLYKGTPAVSCTATSYEIFLMGFQRFLLCFWKLFFRFSVNVFSLSSQALVFVFGVSCSICVTCSLSVSFGGSVFYYVEILSA